MKIFTLSTFTLTVSILAAGPLACVGAASNDALFARVDEKLSLPTIDLSEEIDRHVIVAHGTAEEYQGHPTTLLLPDGKTIYCVWKIGHGGSCGPMKRSDDGGLAWSPLLNTPTNWADTFNCPSLYRLKDPSGRFRLFVFAGRQHDRVMHESYSEDNGRSWTPMASNGLDCVMPFCTITSIDNGRRLLGMTNIRRPGEKLENRSNVLVKSSSSDGGLTCSDWEIVQDIPGLKLCEPEIVRSPDGKQLLCLIRENARKAGGLFMTSDDEGTSWARMQPLPPGLHGDRHKAMYSHDGRLAAVFRDTGKQSPTRNHFVTWIGRYEDILAGRDGEYRL